MKLSPTLFEKILFIILAIRPSLDVFTQLTWTEAILRFNPAALLSLFIIAFGFVCIMSCSKEERAAMFRNPLLIGLCIWILPLLLWAVIPLFTIGMERLSGLREWVRLFSFIPLVMMVLYVTSKTKRLSLIYAVLISFVIPACVGFYQWLTHQGDLIKNVQRVSSTFAHPNSFAFYLVIIICLSVWLFRTSRRKFSAGITFVLSLALLISTFSFTGAITFIVAAFILTICENNLLRIGAVVAVLIFCIAFAVLPTGYQRLQEEIRVENLDMIERTGKETSSLTWRLVNWRFLYRQWKKSPVVGYGLDSTPMINPMLNRDQVGSDAHNDYIRYLAETGALGLGLYLTMLGFTGYALYQAWRRAVSFQAKNLALTSIALFVAWLVASTADNLITVTAYQYSLWTVLAAAYAHKTYAHKTFDCRLETG